MDPCVDKQHWRVAAGSLAARIARLLLTSPSLNRYLHDFPPLEVTEQYGKLWSLSNRRLFIARVLEHIGLVNQVGIMLYPFGQPRVKRVRDGSIKFERSYSNKNGGIQVLVKSLWTWAQSPRE